MPVFSRDGVHILYIHVPKTGGTSVEDFFGRNDFAISYLDRGIEPPTLNAVRRCSPQHMCREQMQAVFNIGQFNYVFMTVRDPYARLLSTFQMRHGHQSSPMTFDGWALGTLQQLPKSPFLFDNHIRPQRDFFVQRAEVFKLENGYDAGWIRHMSSKIGLDFKHREMGRQMISNKGRVVTMSDATKAMIGNVFAEDFKHFGYQR